MSWGITIGPLSIGSEGIVVKPAIEYGAHVGDIGGKVGADFSDGIHVGGNVNAGALYKVEAEAGVGSDGIEADYKAEVLSHTLVDVEGNLKPEIDGGLITLNGAARANALGQDLVDGIVDTKLGFKDGDLVARASADGTLCDADLSGAVGGHIGQHGRGIEANVAVGAGTTIDSILDSEYEMKKVLESKHKDPSSYSKAAVAMLCFTILLTSTGAWYKYRAPVKTAVKSKLRSELTHVVINSISKIV